MRWFRPVVAFCAFGGVCFAGEALELSAFVLAWGSYRFIITNPGTRSNSGWLSIGERFEDHRLIRFSLEDETLTLAHEGAAGGTTQLYFTRDPVMPKPAPYEVVGTRKRRKLSDGITDERKERQIPVWMDAWGNVALGGTAVTFDEIEALFRTLVRANAKVAVVFVHAAVGPRDNPEPRSPSVTGRREQD
jgi:hypothetical protein